jgi:hypothetical protein
MATQGNEAHQGRTEIVPVLFLYGDGTWSHILANIVDNSPPYRSQMTSCSILGLCRYMLAAPIHTNTTRKSPKCTRQWTMHG